MRNAIVLLVLAAMLVFTRAVARPSVDYAAFRNPRRVTAMHRFRWTVIEFVGQLVGALLIGLEGVFIARIVSTVGVSLQLVVSARSATPAVEQRADRSSHDSNIDGERLAS